MENQQIISYNRTMRWLQHKFETYLSERQSNQHFRSQLYLPDQYERKNNIRSGLNNRRYPPWLLTPYIQHIVLPELAAQTEPDPFKISICASFINSTQLDRCTRIKLGLPPKPLYEFPKCRPNFPNPYLRRAFGYSCSYSERSLGHVFTRVLAENIDNEHYTYPFTMYDSMVGKADGYTMAYCTRLQEFPNGTMLVPGVLYSIEDEPTRDLIDDTLKAAHTRTLTETRDIFYHPESLGNSPMGILSINPRRCELTPVRTLFGEL